MRYNPDAQTSRARRDAAYSYSFNLLSQPPGFMGPQVLLAHPSAPTPRVYSCAYIFPTVRSSPFPAFHLCGRAERVMSSERRRRNVNIFHEEFGRAFWFWKREHAPCRELLSKDRRAFPSHVRTLAIFMHLEIFVKNYNAVNRVLSRVKNLCVNSS